MEEMVEDNMQENVVNLVCSFKFKICFFESSMMLL